jgi:hypothetical protein
VHASQKRACQNRTTACVSVAADAGNERMRTTCSPTDGHDVRTAQHAAAACLAAEHTVTGDTRAVAARMPASPPAAVPSAYAHARAAAHALETSATCVVVGGACGAQPAAPHRPPCCCPTHASQTVCTCVHRRALRRITAGKWRAARPRHTRACARRRDDGGSARDAHAAIVQNSTHTSAQSRLKKVEP